MSAGETGFDRLLGIVRRRRWPVAAVAVLAAAVGLWWVKRLPPTYRARAVLRLDDPRPGRDYVASTVNEPTGERLRSRRLSFLARPLVERAAEETGLVARAAAGPTRDRALDAITTRLDARQEGEDAFVLTFDDPDPARARAFLGALAGAYAEWHAHETARRAAATAAFFEREVEALRPRVLEAEARVERYRAEHYGALPEQLEANLRVLDETQAEAHSVRISLDAALARRQVILSEAQSPLRRQEEEIARTLSLARARYAPGSGEVRSLEAELERVRAERHRDERSLARAARRSPELRAAERDAERLRARLDELAAREAELRARVEAASHHAEVLARLGLERDVLRERLRTLVAKHEEAALAAALESDVAGRARVAVVEPAWVAAAPVKPAKPFLGALVLAAAAALALAVGWLLDATDRRVRSVDDVRLVAGDVPLLGVVPPLRRPPAGRRSRGVA